MGLFQDSLKKWFYTNNSSAASSNARVPLLNADGTPKGSDTMANLASVLGGTFWGCNIYSKTVRNDIPFDTGIPVNASNGGRTIIAICSGHSGVGNATHSCIYLIRCGFSDNNMQVELLHSFTGASTAYIWTFGISNNGTITAIGPNGTNKILIIGT